MSDIQFPLFGNSGAHEIARVMRDDWPRFSMAAFVVIGLTHMWDAALEEVDVTEQAFLREGLDPSILDPLFDMLAQRLRIMPDRIARFERLMNVLAIPAPQIVERVKRHMKMTPEEIRREEFQRWIVPYKAEAQRDRDARAAVQSSAYIAKQWGGQS